MREPLPDPKKVAFGDVTVTVLCDGHVETGAEVVVGIDRAVTEDLLAASDIAAPLTPSINVFLIEKDGRKILSDTGAGTSMGSLAGHLPAALARAGVAPSDIDTILLTHIHPDHSNGLIDAEGRAVFGRAEVVVSAEDHAFWVERDPGQAAERFHRNMANARRAFAPYGGRLRLVAAGEVLPGIVGRPLPGHTPGHTGWQVTTGVGDVLLWGDIVHLAAVQIPRPEAGLIFDVDVELARATRKRILAEAAGKSLWIGGAHLPFPGFGRIARDGDGYRIAADAAALGA